MRRTQLIVSALVVALVFLAGSHPSLAASTTGNGAPNGAHYNLNIIGVSKDRG